MNKKKLHIVSTIIFYISLYFFAKWKVAISSSKSLEDMMLALLFIYCLIPIFAIVSGVIVYKKKENPYAVFYTLFHLFICSFSLYYTFFPGISDMTLLWTFNYSMIVSAIIPSGIILSFVNSKIRNF